MRVIYQLTAALNGATPRKVTFLGREFLVVPARLVRSQVLRNNLGASFLPPAVMTEEWASLWNGIPVLVGDHPQTRGQPVSGRSPELWDARGAGWIFNASIAAEEGGIRALRGEVWIDLARVEHVAGLRVIVDRVMVGERVELSTGFPADIENTQGVFNGDAYEIVMHPQGADHLVISTEFTGACSVAHGCGLGVNKGQELPMEQSAAAVPTTPEKETSAEASTNTTRGRLRGIFDRALDFLGGREDTQRAWNESNIAMNVARDIALIQAAPTSDQERAAQLGDALQQKVGNSDKRVVVADIFGDASQVVFWFSTPFGPEPEGSQYYRVDYTASESGFTFSEPVRVQRRTVYESVANAGAGAAATTAQQTTNCGCHQEATMQENEKQALVAEIAAAVNTSLAATLTPLTAQITAANTAAADASAKAVANETALTEIKTQLGALSATVNAEREAERTGLVSELSANSRTPFTAAELEAKPLDELRKLATMAEIPVASFSGRGGPRTAANAEREPAFAEPKPYFAKVANTTEAK